MKGKWLARMAAYVVLLVGSSLVFFTLRHYGRPGGDSAEMAFLLRAYSGVSVYYYRSPLTYDLHQFAYNILAPHGWSPDETIAACSSIAGGFYLCILVTFSLHPLFLLVNLLSGVMYVFLGHVETYAWVSTGLALYCLVVWRYLNGRAALWHVFAVYFLACLFHMLALFYLPSLLYLVFRVERQGGKWKAGLRVDQPEFAKALCVFLVFALIITVVPLVVYITPGLDVNRSRLVPLFRNPNPQRYYFTMFSLEHVKMFVYFIWMGSVAGPMLLLVLWRHMTGRFHRFLLLAVGCGLFFAFVWHPDMYKPDWDLFSNFAIPLNLLVGLLLEKRFPMRWSERVKSYLLGS
jgi:hypothetical protein